MRRIATPSTWALMGVLAAACCAPLAHAAGDAKRGADTFAGECGDCHSAKEGKAKKGPPLFGVVGRKSASVADFAYSDAMRQSGLPWSADRIDAYITRPKKLVPGGKMKYDGLDDAHAREDVIAYLQSLK